MQVRALEATASQAGSHKREMGEAVRRKVVGEVIGNLHRPARPNPAVGQSDSGDSPAKPGDTAEHKPDLGMNRTSTLDRCAHGEG